MNLHGYKERLRRVNSELRVNDYYINKFKKLIDLEKEKPEINYFAMRVLNDRIENKKERNGIIRKGKRRLLNKIRELKDAINKNKAKE